MRRGLLFRKLWPLIAIVAVVFRIESDGRADQPVPADLEKLGDLLPQPAPALEKDPSAYGFRGSPRGDAIAFFRKPQVGEPVAERAPRGEYALFVSDAMGEHARAVSGVVLDEFAPAPAWSPDGTLLAYVYAQQVARGRDGEEWYWAARLAVVDRDGRSNRVIFRQDEGLFKGVAWSPDGRLLAVGFLSAGIYSRSEGAKLDFLTPAGEAIFSIDLVDLRKDSGGVIRLAWSPDGGRVAVATQKALSILDVKARRIRRLAGLDLWPEVPQWSADGRSLAIVSNGTLLLIDSATGAKRTIPFQGRVRAAVWVPGHAALLVEEVREAHDLVDLALLAIGGGHSHRPTPYRYTPYFVSASGEQRCPLTRFAKVSRGGFSLQQLSRVGEALIWWSRG